MMNKSTSTPSRVALSEQSSVVRRSCPNFLCSRIFSAIFPSSMAALSLTTCCLLRSSAVSPCRVAQYTCSKPGRRRCGHRSPKRPTSEVAALRPASSSLSLSPEMPISMGGKSLVMNGTKSIFIAFGIVSSSSRKPRRTDAFVSMAPAWISGTSSGTWDLSIFSSTSASASAEPSCSPSAPERSLPKRYGWFLLREYSGSTCSNTPNAFAASRCTSATGSVSASCSIGSTALRYGLMVSTSCTSMEVEPKICADHFLLEQSRSLRPRTTTGMSREREAGSMSDKKVWLPIFASTACVCFWLVGSASAVTRSCESFLISGEATRDPMSRSTLVVAVRTSARTSSAHSARRGTISGRHCANWAGVLSSIWRRHGSSTSMQPALTFHSLLSIPVRSTGTATAATPWPFGATPSTMALAALMAGAPSLLSLNRATSFSIRGSTKGVCDAMAASRSTALALAAAASFPLPPSAASISAMMLASAFSAAAAGFTSAFASAFAFAFGGAVSSVFGRSPVSGRGASGPGDSSLSARSCSFFTSSGRKSFAKLRPLNDCGRKTSMGKASGSKKLGIFHSSGTTLEGAPREDVRADHPSTSVASMPPSSSSSTITKREPLRREAWMAS
mmetsp:Transcript_58655/g.166860  ORF Transcript_58655/g.166860 Transcript_58655/m.166860 type:complete len:618 (-) Transcript_58655:924-2777(-)